jgi:hypothetical protein
MAMAMAITCNRHRRQSAKRRDRRASIGMSNICVALNINCRLPLASAIECHLFSDTGCMHTTLLSLRPYFVRT